MGWGGVGSGGVGLGGVGWGWGWGGAYTFHTLNEDLHVVIILRVLPFYT